VLLDEPLPAVCPLEDANENTQRAWRNMVTAQIAARDSGVVNPWSFSSLIRAFHQTLEYAEDDEDEFLLRWSLFFGPWRSVKRDSFEPHGEPRFTLEELGKAWLWAQHEPATRS